MGRVSQTLSDKNRDGAMLLGWAGTMVIRTISGDPARLRGRGRTTVPNGATSLRGLIEGQIVSDQAGGPNSEQAQVIFKAGAMGDHRPLAGLRAPQGGYQLQDRPLAGHISIGVDLK
jgi:hypothetical protein